MEQTLHAQLTPRGANIYFDIMGLYHPRKGTLLMLGCSPHWGGRGTRQELINKSSGLLAQGPTIVHRNPTSLVSTCMAGLLIRSNRRARGYRELAMQWSVVPGPNSPAARVTLVGPKPQL